MPRFWRITDEMQSGWRQGRRNIGREGGSNKIVANYACYGLGTMLTSKIRG